VRSRQPMRNLDAIINRLPYRQRPTLQLLPEREPFQQF
jgi:hypothetical protein